MSRARRILPCFRPGKRHDGADGGFSLIEVVVALGLLLAVMATTAGFFTTSLKQSNGQTQAQEAAVLADQQLDYTRSVAGKSLLNGRTQATVAAAIASPPPGVDFSQDITATGNYDPVATGASSQAVPISFLNTVSGTKYTVTTFIDQCYLTAIVQPGLQELPSPLRLAVPHHRRRDVFARRRARVREQQALLLRGEHAS